MYEKVNPMHPDKIADRIAGAIVDIAYFKKDNPKIAVEVLIGHGKCLIIIESNVVIHKNEITNIVERISPSKVDVDIVDVRQDEHLYNNQKDKLRCGDNGIFKGLPITVEEKKLSAIARKIYKEYPFDGKYIIDGEDLIICQSNATSVDIQKQYENARVNPLGDWNGGTDVDTGAVNRKLGSDMAFAVTGGGIHGKDLSKADVSVNIYAFLKAQNTHKNVELSCAIGDEKIDGKDYAEIVRIAKKFIDEKGGFEKFAEWGLI